LRKAAAILYKYPLGLFLLFLLVAYLPVLLPFFHLKNDLLTQNLPTRFVFSESLYSGFEPFWNPYINYGIPQYGDMNNGFWNPVQWLIGSTIGYSIYSITLEELFYIIIGGWGVYKICREFFSKEVAILTGLAYMCTGYVTGHMQYLCWLTGVGYFPYVLLYFLRVNKTPVIKNFVLGGLSMFLFLASTHPGLIIGGIYFILFFLIIIFLNRNDFLKALYHKKFFAINLIFILIGSLLSSIVIVSNLEVLPFISRGSKVSLEEALMHPTTIQSYLSLYLPLAVQKTDFFNTDIGMRNVYTGILTFIGLFISLHILSKRQLFYFLLPLLFFILLSAGGEFKALVWKTLPLLGFVRLNGEFTYFVILLLLFCGAFGLETLWKNETNYFRFMTFSRIITGITLLILLAGIIIIFLKRAFFPETFVFDEIKIAVKNIIDNISIWQLLVIQAIIQLATILFLKKYIFNKKLSGLIFAFNLVIITWLVMPFTGLGMMSKKEVQEIIGTFRRGIETQELVAVKDANYIPSIYETQFMLISSYSKKIGYYHQDQYPVQLKSSNDFFNKKSVFEFISKQAYVFLSTDTTLTAMTNYDSLNINVIRSGPGYTKCVINNHGYKWLTLLQNNYPHWLVKVDGIIVNHYSTYETFISVPVSAGKHEIEFQFIPTRIKTVMKINLALFAAAFLALAVPKIRRWHLFR
jgi:hypothetical protein